MAMSEFSHIPGFGTTDVYKERLGRQKECQQSSEMWPACFYKGFQSFPRALYMYELVQLFIIVFKTSTQSEKKGHMGQVVKKSFKP